MATQAQEGPLAAAAVARRRQFMWSRFLARTVGIALLLILTVAFGIPFYWLISTALKSTEELFAQPPIWIPSSLHWENFSGAIDFFPFWQYLGNTTLIAVGTVIGTLVSNSLIAYGLARIQWRGRSLVFALLLGTLLLPYQVTLVPLFVLFKNLGWVDTYLPLIVPSFFGNAFFMFLLRQFFMTIPNELGDAVRVDGGSDLTIFWRIVLPLSKPALATVALFSFIGAWNDFVGPLVYIQTQSKYTLAIGLSTFLSEYGSEWAKLMAASTLVFIPIVVIFFFTQRMFIQGIALTGIKE